MNRALWTHVPKHEASSTRNRSTQKSCITNKQKQTTLGYSKILPAVFIVLSLFVIILPLQMPVNSTRAVLSYIFIPQIRAAHAVTQYLDGVSSSAAALLTVAEENAALKKEIKDLKIQNAQTDILLRENPAKLTVVEEFLHGTQVKYAKGNKIPIEASVGIDKSYEIKVEWQVRDFMYRHKKIFGWNEAELGVLKSELDYWGSLNKN